MMSDWGQHKDRLYFDYAATSPLHPEVFEAMKPFFTDHFANPSSIHQDGQVCRKAIDEARTLCLESIGAFSPHEIIFTGSGTESCNMAIFGTAFARRDRGKHIVISALEHPAVSGPARYLRDNFGFELTELKPEPDGVLRPEAVLNALRPDTILLSVILANNEIGTLQPIKKIAKGARERGIPVHTDACQAPGFMDINVEHLGVDMLTLNGSKMYGPKGIGLLYVREGLKITPLLHGGGQEFRMRAGTENTAHIVGFAKALEFILKDSKHHAQRIEGLRNHMLEALLALPGVTLNGAREQRLKNNINIHVAGHSGESLVMRLDMDGLAASSGSACSSGKTEASPTLLALGQSQEEALSSLRLTLGRPTTQDEVDQAIAILRKVLA